MSSAKSVLKPYALFEGETINTNLTSPETTLFGVDNVTIVVDWSTSTAVGEIKVEILYDNTTNWVALDFATSIAISGASGSHQIELREVPFGKMRLSYVSTSGSGTLNAWIQGKGV